MKKSKVLILSLCAVMLIATSILGTLAYLTSQDTVVNTFTVGDVDIVLDEAKVNLEGSPLDKDNNVVDDVADADRVEGNAYHLIPGKTYVKDPTLKVVAGSEESYVRMLVTFNKKAELDAIFAPNGADLMSIFKGYEADIWSYIGKTTNGNTITYEFRYFETVDAKDATANIALDPLFTSFTLPGEITAEQLGTLYTDETDRLEITVVGNAIQASGFDTADKAWEAFDTQMSK